ncbi:TRAP transporter large permease subunit [Neptuniibacter sp. CAU 1671]|uniref:TRAP transporter large permease n=1 Tax=Neptuniibacter sp. CAU 1671 TaxID=3032593 RepID=UPI0023DC87EB|nr:TRAP transporter large permease subunit [Neptuniibacter sp. CAU 1671]MDF2183007.1 TRAP transporter large permease subunit [Neptuniibacter sp. CAU 1671]
MLEWLPLLMFVFTFLALLLGYPVAFTLAACGLLFAAIGDALTLFDPVFLQAIPNRVFDIMLNPVLIAVPLFVFMGVMLEKTRIAEALLLAMGRLFGNLPGGLGVAVTLVGALLAASTGIVGATVVTMGLLSLPSMLKRGYAPDIACGTICASGTLGQIIPPSIVLILLGDVISSAYQQSQLEQGIFSPETVTVGDLFLGALIPGILLVAAYIIYLITVAWLRPNSLPSHSDKDDSDLSVTEWLGVLLPPITLIVLVLGSILAGYATPTEAAAVGATGALLLAAGKRTLNLEVLKQTMRETTLISSMVFLILIGASVFSLVFRGLGGDELIRGWLEALPGGTLSAVIVVMLVIFLLGFFLDFIEITFVVLPIVAPILLGMGLDPVWLGIMIALNLQTSFLTPPFGFALFYLRGVTPGSVSTPAIYKGVIPFIFIQLGILILLGFWPALATWLPEQVFG